MRFTEVFTKERYHNHLLYLENKTGEVLNIQSADLQCADLSSANLSGANLPGANLRSANLNHVNLQAADLRSANLQAADLRSANLRSANLRSANLWSANLQYANLQATNLQSADLRNADLRNADLRFCIGNNREVKSFQFGIYLAVLYLNKISIGCQTHTREEWFAFNDDEIAEMDQTALIWWKTYKPILEAICKANPVPDVYLVEKVLVSD
jgi:hypothetical protein